MANCVSCGRETREGQFFCPECYQAMQPEEGALRLEEEPRLPEEQALPSDQLPQQAEGQAKSPEQAIDIVKASVLTPPSEKKVVKAAPVLPEKKAGEKKAKKEKPPKEGPTLGERAKTAAGRAGRGVKGTGRALKNAALGIGRWAKGLALKENAPFDRADWIAWWIGTTASLLLLAAVLFMDLLRFGWMPATPDAFMAEFSTLKAADLGVFGYTLIVLSALVFLLNIWSLASSKWKIRSRINPAFLVALLCVVALMVLPLALASNGAIVRATAGRMGLEPTTELGYAKKTIMYGSYVAALCLVVAFGAAASGLAEQKELPEWMVNIAAWAKEKAKAVVKRPAAGKHAGKKGGSGA